MKQALPAELLLPFLSGFSRAKVWPRLGFADLLSALCPCHGHLGVTRATRWPGTPQCDPQQCPGCRTVCSASPGGWEWHEGSKRGNGSRARRCHSRSHLSPGLVVTPSPGLPPLLPAPLPWARPSKSLPLLRAPTWGKPGKLGAEEGVGERAGKGRLSRTSWVGQQDRRGGWHTGTPSPGLCSAPQQPGPHPC